MNYSNPATDKINWIYLAQMYDVLFGIYTSIHTYTLYICSNYGFGIIISEGIIDYALNVMLLVKCDSRRVVMVSSWGDV